MSFSLSLSSACAVIGLAVSASAQRPAQPSPTPIVLRAARIIDGTGSAPIANGGGVVKDGVVYKQPATPPTAALP